MNADMTRPDKDPADPADILAGLLEELIATEPTRQAGLWACVDHVAGSVRLCPECDESIGLERYDVEAARLKALQERSHRAIAGPEGPAESGETPPARVLTPLSEIEGKIIALVRRARANRYMLDVVTDAVSEHLCGDNRNSTEEIDAINQATEDYLAALAGTKPMKVISVE
jgi:hypothetical protein